MTRGWLSRQLRGLLTGALIFIAVGVVFFILLKRPAPVARPMPLDPVADLGYVETAVPSSQSYTFVYVLERSPGMLKARPIYGGAPRAFTFNQETKSLHAPGVNVPVQTRLVVGHETPFADFLLDSTLLHTERSSLVLNLRPISLKGQIIGEKGELSPFQELVDNTQRPVGPFQIEALGEGRVRITWRGQVHELGPGERWIASEGDPNQSPALGFANFGDWPLNQLTTLR